MRSSYSPHLRKSFSSMAELLLQPCAEAPQYLGRLGLGLGDEHQTWRERLSRSGSVPLMLSQSPGPATTTPQRCSVAYFTLIECCGKDGSFSPAHQIEMLGLVRSSLVTCVCKSDHKPLSRMFKIMRLSELGQRILPNTLSYCKGGLQSVVVVEFGC